MFVREAFPSHMLRQYYDINIASSSQSRPVQPNLKPPITTTEQALKYKAMLQAIDPHIEYLMTIYLSPELTPDEIHKAKSAGIAGVLV